MSNVQHVSFLFLQCMMLGGKKASLILGKEQCTILPKSGKDCCGMSDFYLMMDVGHVLKQNNSHSRLCKRHMFVHTTAYVNSMFAHHDNGHSVSSVLAHAEMKRYAFENEWQ